jgi:hypothetical protein
MMIEMHDGNREQSWTFRDNIGYNNTMLKGIVKILLSFWPSFRVTPSQCNQHRLEELITLCPVERKSPAPMAADVTLKSLVRAELDRAHIASSLLHADEIVDVDVGALDVLSIARSVLTPCFDLCGSILPACSF